MFFIFGTKSFFIKTKSYKSVWCIHCEKPVVATKIRRFAMWHLFYIPLLPLGFRTEWRCAACNKDPHASMSIYDGIGMLLLALMFGSVFFSEKHSANLNLSQGWLWGLRIFFVLCALYSISVIVKRLQPAKSKHPVDPLNNTECLVCSNEIDATPNAICSGCGVMREGL